MKKGIVIASIIEAMPFIKRFNLKQINTKFEIFESDSIILIVSGIGRLNSAIATTHLLSIYEISIVINIGIAGSINQKVGDIYLINKIKDNLLNKDFYPDILLAHLFDEDMITTYDKPISKDDEVSNGLVDMECSSFYFASSKFLAPHKIMAIKIVSDNLTPQIINKEYVNNLIEEKLDVIEYFLNRYNFEEIKILSEIESRLLDKISDNLKLTFNQKVQLIDKAKYLKLNNKFEKVYQFENIQTNKKEDRGEIFGQIKKL